MYSTDRPIVFTDTNANYTNEYKEYKVTLQLWNQSFTQFSDVPIYTGRTWYNADHTTTIYLSTILRDYTYRNEVVFDATEMFYKPKNLGVNAIPVEMRPQNQFYTTYAKVIINNQVAGTLEVTAQNYSALVQNKYYIPYDATMQFSKSHNPFDIAPHLPNISTNKIWLGLNYCQWLSGVTMKLNCNNTMLTVGSGNMGNYFFNIPLNTIVDAFALVTGNNEFDIVQLNTFDMNIDMGSFDALILDNCPKDYYILWCNSYGFFSWGCAGKNYVETTAENETMQNILGAKKNIRTINRYGWTLNTGMINDKEKQYISTLAEAENVWLYDTKLDKTFNCTADNGTLRNITENGKIENATLNLTEIIQHIQ